MVLWGEPVLGSCFVVPVVRSILHSGGSPGVLRGEGGVGGAYNKEVKSPPVSQRSAS